MRPVFTICAAFAAALCGFTLSACNGGGTAFGPATQSVQSHRLKTSPANSPTPIPYAFSTVDDPNSLKNRVTGINDLKKIVGVWGGGQSSNQYMSYSSEPPYTKFRGLNYPGAQGTYATSIENRLDGGFVIDPPGHTGTLGFLKVNGIWTPLADPDQGTGDYAITEILGLNANSTAVGFYVNPYGTKVPFVLDIRTLQFTDLSPPGATDAEATSINRRGEITGWDVTSDGTIKGFFDQANTYYPYSAPGAQSTYGMAVNYHDVVAGYYLDASGVSHGFVMTSPTWGAQKQVWQTVDVPHSTGTWITGINGHADICGYYTDSYGIEHGFVGDSK